MDLQQYAMAYVINSAQLHVYSFHGVLPVDQDEIRTLSLSEVAFLIPILGIHVKKSRLDTWVFETNGVLV